MFMLVTDVTSAIPIWVGGCDGGHCVWIQYNNVVCFSPGIEASVGCVLILDARQILLAAEKKEEKRKNKYTQYRV